MLWPTMPLSELTAEADAEALAVSAPAPQVVFLDVQPWSAKEADLFDKMRAAMKLSKAQTKIIFANPSEIHQKGLELLTATSVIFFSPELATHAPPLGEDIFQITTFGPRELLQSPQLKKQSWDDLQKVMKKLN